MHLFRFMPVLALLLAITSAAQSVPTQPVANLDAIKAKYIAPPAKLYGEARAASLIGPAGELMELIEEKRA